MLEAPPIEVQGKKSLVSAIFIFGDSTADPGNNNYITTPFKSNFSPYGKDFPNHVSTGRFSNGMLVSDFVAKHVGVKEYVPPYLDKSLSNEELETGVSFASAGTGFDPLTPRLSSAIPLSKQLENFKEYEKKMEAAIGKEQARKLIKEALFIVSAGTNDFVVSYSIFPMRREKYTVSAYADYLLQHAHNFLQELLDRGARKIGVTGLPPMGCLPIVITLHSDNRFSKRDCIDSYSSTARDYNFKLQKKLNDIMFANLGSRIAYMDIYAPMVDMIQGNKYDHVPTGRFTNGMLANDFIARYVGVKEYVPPYLDKSLSNEELKTGVSFASAGTGFDPLTPKISNVISLSKQLENFKEYEEKMEAAIGKEQTQNLIKEALFIVSAGTNDFVVNYNTLPIRSKNYTLSTYTDFLLQQLHLFLQELLDKGARKIGVVGLPPMGCLPIVITLHSDNAFSKRDCIDFYSSIARDYNSKLQKKLNDMQIRLANLGSRIAYMDIYAPMGDMILGHKYDFEKANIGCCGTGLLEASFMCNPNSYVCPNASKYVFWDSIHPTEKAYYIVSQALQPTIDSITKY
ncbi:hypothetical protein HAX54_021121 [Datura stramonium]|uniref:GDSL esterase/lipase n=1 Tax=Datura stramonium TaxID=4076 RepID=A0ABS8S310_DATST|nr:hypothetical protein [Datura stramonium]